MAINIETHGKNTRNYTFPALFIDEYEKLIVLLTAPGTGTVIQPGTTSYQHGYVGSYWKMDRLVPFNGRVTLENK